MESGRGNIPGDYVALNSFVVKLGAEIIKIKPEIASRPFGEAIQNESTEMHSHTCDT